jgi:hypothetical protein
VAEVTNPDPSAGAVGSSPPSPALDAAGAIASPTPSSKDSTQAASADSQAQQQQQIDKSMAKQHHLLLARKALQQRAAKFPGVTATNALILWLCLVVVFLLVLPQLFRRKRAKSGQRSD